MLEYTLKRLDKGVLLIEMVGDLRSCDEAQALRGLLGESIEISRIHAIMDLERVRFIDSFGLGYLAILRGMLLENDGLLILIRPSEVVTKILNYTGFYSLVPVFDSVFDARSYLREASEEILATHQEKTENVKKQSKRTDPNSR